MADEVKFIFKTLIKVPVIIFFAYLVMNVFFFFFIYFKVLGISYVVMQTAVENNYLPTSEYNTLCDYIDNLNDIPMVNGSAQIIVGEDGSGGYRSVGVDAGQRNMNIMADGDARSRRQYGGTVTCGISCGFKLVWPLTYRETTIGETGVNGTKGTSFTGFKSDAQLQAAREAKLANQNNIINIAYTVPGLKYYPDLRTK